MNMTPDSNNPTDHPCSTDHTLTLSTPVQFVPGVGPARAILLNRLNIKTTADLIKHLPSRWEYHAGLISISQLPVDTLASTSGEVTTCRFIPGRAGKSRFILTLEDQTNRLDITFFNTPYLKNDIHPGMCLQVTGKVTLYDDHRQMINPLWKIHTDEAPIIKDEHYQPVYPTTEDLPTSTINRIINNILPTLLPYIDDHLTDEFRESHILPTLSEAYRMLHSPANEDEIKIARRRLAYDELLLLQVGLAVKRYHTQNELIAQPLKHTKAIDSHIRSHFPFTLTDSQNSVIKEITNDLKHTVPMNRLIQGDVGSGKTVVALYALLLATASGKQGAIMAPTELLAEQHYLSITSMLKKSNVNIALLTGSLTAKQRKTLHNQIENAEIDIVIGTQALLTASLQFSDLAVVVIDEQHRFGVMQRATIRSKNAHPNTTPHYLVMTATPIPRSLGLTIFGDLDISTIDSLPPGRQPIVTRVVTSEQSDDVYNYITNRVDNGEQAYIVLAAIDDSTLNIKSVRSHAELLRKKHFPNHTVAIIHGQLKTDEREQVMGMFRDHQIDVLVATTVIEVGIDIPNASIIVVENAERFGLAQLHQLRGRVGRGTVKSLAVFIAQPTTDSAQQRMQAIATQTDGFTIAESDFLIRGMGDFFGTQQAGLPPLRIANIPDDMELLQLARRDAQQIVNNDPKLSSQKNLLLRARLLKQYRNSLALADVG